MDGAAKVAGVGCDMPPPRGTPLTRLIDRTYNYHSYPKLGMRLGNQLETPSFGIGSDVGCGRSFRAKHRLSPQASISLGLKMIKLHGYPMKNYKMTCATPLPQLPRAETDLFVEGCQ
jgi:hypothetical protein